MKWRVYYEDGSIWDYTQGLNGMPAFGVICILQKGRSRPDRDPRYHIVYGCTYYMRSENEWLHARENDVVDYLIHDKPIEKLLVGRMTSKLKFNDIYGEAKNDKDKEIFS